MSASVPLGTGSGTGKRVLRNHDFPFESVSECLLFWRIIHTLVTVRGEKHRVAAQHLNMETPSIDADLLPVPRGLECQICLELMQDPVATVDGHSYCRQCIVESRETFCGIRFGPETHAKSFPYCLPASIRLAERPKMHDTLLRAASRT